MFVCGLSGFGPEEESFLHTTPANSLEVQSCLLVPTVAEQREISLSVPSQFTLSKMILDLSVPKNDSFVAVPPALKQYRTI